MNFSNMKLGVKLIGAFVLISIISAIVSGIGVRNMALISGNADRTYRQDLVGLNQIQQANGDVLRVGTYLRNAILASSAEARNTEIEKAEKGLASAREHLTQAEPLVYSEKGKAIFSDLDKSWEDFVQAFNEMKAQIKAAGPQEKDSLTQYLLNE